MTIELTFEKLNSTVVHKYDDRPRDSYDCDYTPLLYNLVPSAPFIFHQVYFRFPLYVFYFQFVHYYKHDCLLSIIALMNESYE